MSYKVYADGKITKDGHYVRAHVGKEAKGIFLTTRMMPSYIGIETGLDLNIDVQNVASHRDLDAIVGALLEGQELPAGWAMKTRKDGLSQVVRA